MASLDTRVGGPVTRRSSAPPASAVTSSGSQRPVSPRGQKRLSFSHNRIGWIFVAPLVIILSLFTVLPAVIALAMSFTDIGAADLRDPFAVNFTAFDTFIQVLTDQTFLRALFNTTLFVVISVPLTVGIAFVLALILNNGIRRLKSFFRAAIYLPVITNIVAAAVIWQYAFTVTGPVNAGLETLSIHGPNWLGDPVWAVPTVAALGIWRNIGTCMIFFLAGLQGIPEEVEEAASMDGAGYWGRVLHMTIPLLRPTTLLVMILMTVSFLNIFDEPYLVTHGGPLGSTQSLALWVYEQFGYGNIAPSMAGSFILLALVGIIAAVQFRVLRPKH